MGQTPCHHTASALCKDFFPIGPMDIKKIYSDNDLALPDLDLDLTRHVTPSTPEEELIAKKIDAFFEAHYAKDRIAVDQDYRIRLAPKPIPLQKDSLDFFCDLASIVSSDNPLAAFCEVMRNRHLNDASDAIFSLANQIKATAFPNGLSDPDFFLPEPAFFYEYVDDVVFIQVPYQHYLKERILARLSFELNSNILDCTMRYDPNKDPRITQKADRPYGEISLIFDERAIDRCSTAYAHLRIIDSLLIFSAYRSSEPPAGSVTIPAGTAIFGPQCHRKNYLLSRDTHIPIASVHGISLGWPNP